MGLAKKNFYYSILISVVFVALVAGYFAWMLPSLYADYVNKDNLESVTEQHKGFVQTGSYENLEVKNPTSSFSIELPLEGNEISVTSKFFQMTLRVRDERLKKALYDFRVFISQRQAGDEVLMQEEALWGAEDAGNLLEIVLGEFRDKETPVQFDIKLPGSGKMVYSDANTRMHVPSEGILVMESTVTDTENQYTSYIVIEQVSDRYVFTILPAMTPKMDEITPIVFGSLPMIGVVVLLLVLLFSQVYSRGIVNPIIRLAHYTQDVKNRSIYEIQPVQITRKDEIGMLAEELNEMHRKLRDNYMELEQKNRLLEEENKRQEVFLRASSHQLKTPVTAALLLVEGMMQKVGKYENWEEYLPQVKVQMLSMRKIIEEILSLNHSVEQFAVQKINVQELFEEILGHFRVHAADKKLVIEQTGTGGSIAGKRELLERIAENLVSNAVNYTPDGERIRIHYSGDGVRIENCGVLIPEEILPHIFEPFVSSERKEKGHGLGLYVASYYARLASCRIEIHNGENRVITLLSFWQEK